MPPLLLELAQKAAQTVFGRNVVPDFAPAPRGANTDHFPDPIEAPVDGYQEGPAGAAPEATPEPSPEAIERALTALDRELRSAADTARLPHDRIAEILPLTGPGGRYDPLTIYERYAERIPPDILETRIRALLLDHPEVRALLADTVRNYAAEHGPRLAASIGALIGFEKIADLLDIKDPAARFAFIVGSTHVVAPVTNNLADAGRMVWRRANGRVITHLGGNLILTRQHGLGSSLWQVGRRNLTPAGKGILAKFGHGTAGVIGTIVGTPFQPKMGRDLLWSRLWTALIPGKNTRVVDGVTVVDTNTWVESTVGLLGFFTEQIADLGTKGAMTRFMASRGLVAVLGRAAGAISGAGFGADILSMTRSWLVYGNAATSYSTFAHTATDQMLGPAAKFSGSARTVLGTFRWAGIGKTFIDDTYAGGTFMTPLVDAGDQIGLWLGWKMEQETRAAMATHVWYQAANNVKGFLQQLQGGLQAVLIDGEDGDGTEKSWAARIRDGSLERVELPARLQAYDRSVDRAEQNLYNLIRSLETFRIHPAAAAIADLFDEDFRELPFGSPTLEHGMRVIAEGAEERLLAWLGGREAILADRRAAFAEAWLRSEIEYADAGRMAQQEEAHAEQTRTTANPEIMHYHEMASRRRDYFHTLAREAGRADGEAIVADAAYYRALGDLSRTIGLGENDAHKRAFRRFASDRLNTVSLSPDAAVRARARTELTVMNPHLIWGRDDENTRQAARLMQGPAEIDLQAMDALRESVAFWTDRARDELARDLYAQTAASAPIAYAPVLRERAATETFQMLVRHELDPTITQFFHYAIDDRRAVPEALAAQLDPPNGRDRTGTFALLDATTGLPKNATALAQLVAAAVDARFTADAEAEFMQTRAGDTTPGTPASVATWLEQSYHQNSAALGRILATWYVDAQLAGVDPTQTLEARLHSTEGTTARTLMREQIAIDARGVIDFGDGYHAATLYDAHARVDDWSTLIRWFTLDAPQFLQQEYARRIETAFAEWYTSAIAGNATDDTAIQGYIAAQLTTPEGIAMKTCIARLAHLETEMPEKDRLKVFTVDAEGRLEAEGASSGATAAGHPAAAGHSGTSSGTLRAGCHGREPVGPH
ncbi:MAG: hypothetical protein HYV02_03795 [Deltaproteobacteria bacterium]|nr:hypothetical protein [Deltaproteobacteria bacterium]